MIRGKMVLLSVPERMNWLWSELARKWRSKFYPRTGAHTTLMRGAFIMVYIDLDIEGQKELPYWIDLALSL